MNDVVEMKVTLTIKANYLDEGEMENVNIDGKDILLNYDGYNALLDTIWDKERLKRRLQLAEQLELLHAIDTDKLGEYQYLQGRIIGKLEAYEKVNQVLSEEGIDDINRVIATLENISDKNCSLRAAERPGPLEKGKEMLEIAIENKTSETVEVLKNDEVMLIDGWLRVQTYEGMIVEMNYTAVPVVESYVYFWHDYLPRIAKATKLHEWDIQYNLWVDSIENDFKLAIV